MAHPIFIDPVVTPAGSLVQGRMPGAGIASAMMAPRPMAPPSLGGGAPLASLLAGMKSSGATSSDPNLIWNPNNPIGTDALAGNTINQGSTLANAAATWLPGYQGNASPPAAPGMVGPQSPGAYQPQAGDQALMDMMRQSGALAPQYQGMQAPQPGLLARIFGGSNG